MQLLSCARGFMCLPSYVRSVQVEHRCHVPSSTKLDEFTYNWTS